MRRGPPTRGEWRGGRHLGRWNGRSKDVLAQWGLGGVWAVEGCGLAMLQRALGTSEGSESQLVAYRVLSCPGLMRKIPEPLCSA